VALVVPTVLFPNDRDVGEAERDAAGADTPVPDNEMGMVLPPPVIV
jgi:hypothetical protein